MMFKGHQNETAKPFKKVLTIYPAIRKKILKQEGVLKINAKRAFQIILDHALLKNKKTVEQRVNVLINKQVFIQIFIFQTSA